ncbi:MAG TPA: hypothetical protein VGR15_09040 [Bacteroidota bacterium]|nr:hypothetical protein [Bacteroidota bacterium]
MLFHAAVRMASFLGRGTMKKHLRNLCRSRRQASDLFMKHIPGIQAGNNLSAFRLPFNGSLSYFYGSH